MSQPDGSYPRLNGTLLRSGKFNGQIVSLVGQFGSDPQQFICCDNVAVHMDTQQAEGMQMIPGTIAEIVGHTETQDSSILVFVVRQLSPDTDLEIYNKMLAVQHDPKFAHYFAAAADGMVAH